MKILNITFVISTSRTRKDNKAPLVCRLLFQKKRKQFSTGLSINPNNWNSKQQLVEPPEPDEQYINTQLSLIRQKLNQAFLFLQVKGSPFDVMDIYTEYLGETPTQINNSELINTLTPGLYNIQKNYLDGSTEQVMILKENE
jgi:integrase/recombinase XerD